MLCVLNVRDCPGQGHFDVGIIYPMCVHINRGEKELEFLVLVCRKFTLLVESELIEKNMIARINFLVNFLQQK